MPQPSAVRTLVAIAGATACAAAALAVPTATAVARGSATVEPARQAPDGIDRRVTVDEGTNMAVAVSPDGERLVTDLQGFLWTLPAEGGRADRQTDALLDPALPDWSPTEDRVVVQAYRDGTFDLFELDPDGSAVTKLTRGPYDDREPRYSPDGTAVAFASDRAGSYDIWVLDLTSGGLEQWTDAATEEYQPTWSPDGTEIAHVVGEPTGVPGDLAASTVQATAADGSTRVLASEPTGDIHSPSWSPGGEHLAYSHLDEDGKVRLVVDGQVVSGGEDVFAFPVEWTAEDEFVYTSDGQIRRRTLDGSVRRIPFTATFRVRRPDFVKAQHELDPTRRLPVQGIVAPEVSPDGRRIAFCALGDLWVLRIGDPTPRRLTRTTYLEADPAWAPGGARLLYSSDRRGSMDLWARTLATGEDRRVTSRPGTEYGGAWSPDGTLVSFQDQAGSTYTTPADGSGSARAVDVGRFLPGASSWAPDSRLLALAAVDPYSQRFREGTSQMLVVDTESGDNHFVEPAPNESLSTRGPDGPVWSPDGSMLAFVMRSALWVRPVDAEGRGTGPAVRVTGEVSDSPTWFPDSDRLLYVSNGELRTVAVSGGAPEPVPLELTWRPQRHDGRVVVHTGALWDGVSRRLRRDVDVIVRGNRIVAVRPHARDQHRGRVVDGSGLTAMPGLFDSHIHNELYGRALGARKGRLYLAYGITSAQSVGDQVYRAIEDEESYAAGTQVGPRYFATGEAVDGSRVYYDFMRPTLTERQLRTRELARARALGYDMIKSYVRLPADLNQVLVAAAHMMGVPSLSHYLYPGLAFGQDGQTHISATQRLGYSRTQSLGGVSYGDMSRLFARSRSTLVPTLFDSSSLLAEDSTTVTDRRATGLMPTWYYAQLAEEALVAESTDQTAVRRLLRLEVQALRAVLDRGGVITAGTDSPLDQVGLSTHMNLRAMVRYGVDEYDALRSATAVAARVLGEADDLGTVRPGRLADLVLVDGNPLRRIRKTDDVRYVLKGGRVFTVDSLLRPYDGRGGSARAAGLADLADSADVREVRRSVPDALAAPEDPEHAH